MDEPETPEVSLTPTQRQYADLAEQIAAKISIAGEKSAEKIAEALEGRRRGFAEPLANLTGVSASEPLPTAPPDRKQEPKERAESAPIPPPIPFPIRQSSPVPPPASFPIRPQTQPPEIANAIRDRANAVAVEMPKASASRQADLFSVPTGYSNRLRERVVSPQPFPPMNARAGTVPTPFDVPFAKSFAQSPSFDGPRAMAQMAGPGLTPGVVSGGKEQGGSGDIVRVMDENTRVMRDLIKSLRENDEDETEQGENAPRPKKAEGQQSNPIVRIERSLPTIAQSAPLPTRPQPPIP